MNTYLKKLENNIFLTKAIISILIPISFLVNIKAFYATYLFSDTAYFLMTDENLFIRISEYGRFIYGLLDVILFSSHDIDLLKYGRLFSFITWGISLMLIRMFTSRPQIGCVAVF